MDFVKYMEYVNGMLRAGRVPWLFIYGDPILDKAASSAFRFELPGLKGRDSGKKRVLCIVRCDRVISASCHWNDLVLPGGMIYRFYSSYRFSQMDFWPVFSYDDVPTAVRFWFSRGRSEPARTSPRGMKAFAAQVELTLSVAGAF